MKQVDHSDSIQALLYEFDDIFPHNKEKVSDYAGWAEKLYTFGYVFVEQLDGKNIGLVAFYANDTVNRIGFISLIGIKNDYQKAGLGQCLLQESLSFMKQAGMVECRLEVEKNNVNAMRFYQKNGFSMLEERERSFIYSLKI